MGNTGSAAVTSSNLDGSGATDLNITGSSGGETGGIAIDSSAGKVFWADIENEKIDWAGMDGRSASPT